MRTTQLRKEDVQPKWYVVDAKDRNLGRLASHLAMVLMGKHKPDYTPHVDNGDFVIVINCDKFATTGNRINKKVYGHYTGYPGGWREESMTSFVKNHPEQPLALAVRRMLPKNRLGRKMFLKLKLYAEDTHPHQAQKPQPMPETLLVRNPKKAEG